MVSCLVLSLLALPVCLAVVQLLSACSAQFAVVGPPEPVLAMVGEDAELPCHLFPNMSAEHMELMWVQASTRQVVHTYTPGQEDTLAAEYGGRTSILREDITSGKAALQIRDLRASDSGTYVCHFQDGDFSAQALVELKVPGPFFQSAQPSRVAFPVTLPTLLLLLVGAGSCLWRQQKKIQVLSQEKERERSEKEGAQEEKEAAQAEREAAQAEKEVAEAEKEAAEAKEQQERSTKEKLKDELRWRMIPYLPREERSQAYAALKMALFQPVNVFLDPDMAHPALLVSEDKRSLQRADAWQKLPKKPKRFCGNECVLGCKSFMSGRHFWEVEVGDRAQWCIGVCRENMRKKVGDKMTPANGFWTVGLNSWNDYRALTDPQTTLTNVSPPERVGVFLDYELGEVSFYNAISGSHIFTFPHTRFYGTVRPVFCILTSDPTPLTICPAQKIVVTFRRA